MAKLPINTCPKCHEKIIYIRAQSGRLTICDAKATTMLTLEGTSVTGYVKHSRHPKGNAGAEVEHGGDDTSAAGAGRLLERVDALAR